MLEIHLQMFEGIGHLLADNIFRKVWAFSYYDSINTLLGDKKPEDKKPLKK